MGTHQTPNIILNGLFGYLDTWLLLLAVWLSLSALLALTLKVAERE